MNNSGIYIIISPSGRGYIGSSKELSRRKWSHFYKLKNGKHHCSALQRAWNKYGEALKFVVIEYCSVEILIQREQFWIDNHKIIIGRMYNASSIAGRPEHTVEVREKIAKVQRGKVHTLEHRMKNAEANRGRKHSHETIIKMKERKHTEEQRLKMKLAASKRDYSKNAERMRLIGLASKGRKLSAEHRAKMSEAQRRRYSKPDAISDATREKLRRPRGKRGPLTGAALASNQAGAIKRVETVQNQRAREHWERLNWICPPCV